MTSRGQRSRVRTLGMLLGVMVGSIVPGVSAVAAPPLPPDDGAPPEEYLPSPEAVTSEDGSPSAASTEEVGELPATPPTDNAFPVSGASRTSCSNNFGQPRSPDRIHMGVDCFAPLGRPLVAVESGTIRYATPGEPFSCATGGDISGNRVSVRGLSGYVYYYGHLDTILVAADQYVEKGQVIGTVGWTGNAACSRPHLHFEVKCGEHGDPFDPYPWLGVWGRPGPPAPAWPSTEGYGAGVVVTGTDRQDMFALECGRAIRQRTWTARSGLSPWLELPGAATSDPDAASPGPGVPPQVFVRGLDFATYQLYWNGSSWQGTSLGGYCTSGPSAVYSSPIRLDVFCRGGDSALYQKAWDAAVGWSEWYRVGGFVTSDPDAASPGPNYPAQVFVRGRDNAIYQQYWDGSSWQGNYLGGYCTSGPSAVYSGPERLDVYCRGGDMAVWHRQWRLSTGWAEWSRIHSHVISDPEASSGGPGSPPQVFGRGADRRVYQLYWDGSTWVGRSWGLT